MNIVITVLLASLGLVMGSFAGAQVWRLRARQLAEDKKQGENYDRHEYAKLKPLMGRKQRQDRSQCLACRHVLSAVDLVPLFSWAVGGGKCRYCGARIGMFEPAMELATAAIFALSYMFWPFELAVPMGVALFVVWLLAVVLMVILAAYDIKWQLLPDVINFSFIGVALIFATARLFGGAPFDAASTLGAIAVLAGLYGLIYLYSKGEWIGLGDVKLGIGLGLLLGNWQLAFLALTLANFIGLIVVMPGIVLKRLSGGSRIAFGPLLIVGTLIAFLWGAPFVDWLFHESLFL